MLFESQAREDFEVKSVVTSQMQNAIRRYGNIFEGKPEWVDADDDIKTVNFAKAVCAETARLAMLGTKITIAGKNAQTNPRADWLQKQIDGCYYDIQNWVEYACGYGMVVLKPNGVTVDVVTPNRFMVTGYTNGDINGMVFVNKVATDFEHYYTRLEYHRFLADGNYQISNKCYLSEAEDVLGDPINIEDTPWNTLTDDATIQNLERPLYAVLRMPNANTIDVNSPMRLPIFAEAVEELKDLDVAYSRNAHEILESRRTVLIDADALIPDKNIQTNPSAQKAQRKRMELPEFVRNVTGSGSGDYYQEINPTLNTVVRLTGIDALLSQIGYKCGYSNGYFVFNQKTGMVTATQIEAEDRRTIQFIKAIRDQLEKCLDGLIYALNKFADLYDLAPLGDYEITYDFGDLTYNREEDRARWITYVNMGLVPAWKIFEKFEGMSEEEAKAMVQEARESMQEASLFAGME